MKSCAVVVVGHVDHGKTALVRALTGQETDRLEEEKRRGMSITLGFAHRAYASGQIDFIDSPGHEDFIRTMVCGATGAQAALVAISAVDGIERQTREHLDILGYLDVRCGIIAFTKADLVSKDQRASIRAEVVRSLAGSPFAAEPHVFCSSATGEGLGDLNLALEALIHRAPVPALLPGSFLPVDRVFSVKGVGAVATGTLQGEPMTLGEDVAVMPQGVAGTIRRLQSRGADVTTAHPGTRTAVNLRGVGVNDLQRGDVIGAPGAFRSTLELDAWVEIPPGSVALRQSEDVRVLVGTAVHVATPSIWGEQNAVTGAGAYVRLRFREKLTTHARQRGIIRRLSPAETIGGLLVIDPQAPPARRRDPNRVRVLGAAHNGGLPAIAEALAEAGLGVAHVSDILRLAGIRAEALDMAPLGFEPIDAGRAAPGSVLGKARSVYVKAVREGLKRQPTLASLPAAEIRQALALRFAEPLLLHVERLLLEAGELVGDHNRVALPVKDLLSGLGVSEREKLEKMERALLTGGTSPPSLAELQAEKGPNADLVNLLVKSGKAVRLRNLALDQLLVFHTEAISAAFQRLCEAFPPPVEFTTSEARSVLEASRKFVIPILEHFDRTGRTRRTGDVRRITPPEV